MLGTIYGHWVGETLAWIRAAQALRIPLDVFSARGLNQEMARATGARGVFGLTPEITSRYGMPAPPGTGDPYCQPMINFMLMSEAFRRACREIQKAGIGAGDLLAIPYARDYELHGAALWLEEIPAATRPLLLFNVHEPPPRWRADKGRDSVEGDYLFERYAARRLRSVQPQHRMMVTAADQRLCDILQHAYDLPCGLTPMLMDYRQPPEPGGVRADSAPTIGVLGAPREEKGGALVARALLEIVRQRPAVRLLMQLGQEKEAVSLRGLLAPHLPESNLRIHVGPMSKVDYLAWFWQTDLALLPYDWKRYAARSSGIFTEAVAYGIPVVAPRNTGMSDHLDAGRGVGETFDEWNAGSIAAAAVRALDRIDELKASAAAVSSSWREKQSIHAYLRIVMTWWRQAMQQVPT